MMTVKYRLRNFRVALLGLSLVIASWLDAGVPALENWPDEAEPERVGTRIAEWWLQKPFRFETSRRTTLSYSETCSWYGALEVARLSGNDELEAALVERFDRFMGPDANAIGQQRHVDYSISGVLPLELYILTGKDVYREMGLFYADRQWDNPREDGLSEESRFWIDDLYMLPILQVQAFRATGDRIYLERAARTMAAYLDSLQMKNGLFYHAPDSPFYWGRGNGWVAAGMAELLRDLTSQDKHYDRIFKGFQSMMNALLNLQTENGMWRQLLDDESSWEESSCTGMFTFAIVTGVKRELLDSERFGPVARRGWLALVSAIDENDEIREVCVGTNKASEQVGEDLETQKQYYLDRPRAVGDFHGQAPILWVAAALMR